MSTGISTAALMKRERNVLLASAATVCVLSWLFLAYQHPSFPLVRHPLGAPHALTFGPGPLALAVVMWIVMMVAMMLPPVMPWIMLFATMSRSQTAGEQRHVPVVSFGAGYLAIWAAYSMGAALLQLTLQQSDLLRLVEIDAGTRAGGAGGAGGALLVVAGLFQLTSLKAACLKHCRSPLGYFLSHWRNGPLGAFQMGFRHGVFCVGCCWALMGLMFALGVMNLLWMAVLTLMICIEKIAPRGQMLSRVFGALFLGWGMWLVV
jgi:predicted metal-binding membrane protein